MVAHARAAADRNTHEEGSALNAHRGHRWLALLPALAICVGVPLVDRLHASVGGIPLLLVWIVGCVIMTSVVMAIVDRLDRRSRP